jgi:hypothetical protein
MSKRAPMAPGVSAKSEDGADQPPTAEAGPVQTGRLFGQTPVLGMVNRENGGPKSQLAGNSAAKVLGWFKRPAAGAVGTVCGKDSW